MRIDVAVQKMVMKRRRMDRSIIIRITMAIGRQIVSMTSRSFNTPNQKKIVRKEESICMARSQKVIKLTRTSTRNFASPMCPYLSRSLSS